MMRLLRSWTHPDLSSLDGSTLHRRAARAIALRGENILLLYTAYYQDYSLPGGGVDSDESVEDGLVRELEEETGARDIQILKPFGLYEEYRPWYKPDHDIIHIESHCFVCNVAKELGPTRYESYEKKNGMTPQWMNIHQAISHNERIMKDGKQKGMSMERETFLLKLIATELVGHG